MRLGDHMRILEEHGVSNRESAVQAGVEHCFVDLSIRCARDWHFVEARYATRLYPFLESEIEAALPGVPVTVFSNEQPVLDKLTALSVFGRATMRRQGNGESTSAGIRETPGRKLVVSPFGGVVDRARISKFLSAAEPLAGAFSISPASVNTHPSWTYAQNPTPLQEDVLRDVPLTWLPVVRKHFYKTAFAHLFPEPDTLNGSHELPEVHLADRALVLVPDGPERHCGPKAIPVASGPAEQLPLIYRLPVFQMSPRLDVKESA